MARTGISGIYAIKNTETGKLYVGSSVNIQSRWTRHKAELRAGEHVNPKLRNAWAKYGEKAFQFSILEVVPDQPNLIHALVSLEDSYIHSLSPAYNCKMASEGGRYIPTDTDRDRISKALKGRPFTDEHKRKIGEANRGRIVSPETRAKIGAFSKTRKHTEQTRDKIGTSRKGYHHSEETKERIRASNVGKPKPRGESSHQFDKQIYTFAHEDGQVFVGTQMGFRSQFLLLPSGVSCLARGRSTCYRGWRKVSPVLESA